MPWSKITKWTRLVAIVLTVAFFFASCHQQENQENDVDGIPEGLSGREPKPGEIRLGFYTALVVNGSGSPGGGGMSGFGYSVVDGYAVCHSVLAVSGDGTTFHRRDCNAGDALQPVDTSKVIMFSGDALIYGQRLYVGTNLTDDQVPVIACLGPKSYSVALTAVGYSMAVWEGLSRVVLGQVTERGPFDFVGTGFEMVPMNQSGGGSGAPPPGGGRTLVGAGETATVKTPDGQASQCVELNVNP